MNLRKGLFMLATGVCAAMSGFSLSAEAQTVPPAAPAKPVASDMVLPDPTITAPTMPANDTMQSIDANKNTTGTSNLPEPVIPKTPAAPAASATGVATPPAATQSGGKIDQLPIPSPPAAPSGAPMSSDVPPPPPLPGDTPVAAPAAPATTPTAPAATQKPAATPATPADTQKPTAASKTKAKSGKHSKHGKKHHRKHKKSSRTAEFPAADDGSLPHTRVRLPENIYKKSYDVHNRHLPVAHYEGDYDALVFLTAAQNNLNGLRALLDSGRNVDMTDAKGDTPLIVAVRNNASITARLLLARHANPNLADRSGQTPLAIATQMGNEPVKLAILEMIAQYGR